MIKISDIFEKYRKDKEKKEKSLPSDSKKETPSIEVHSAFEIISEEKIHQKIVTFYENLISIASKIYKPNAISLDLIKELKNKISQLIEINDLESQDLLKLFFKDYPNIKDYLYYNVVNTTILSLEVAKALNFERERLFNLGLGAFLHKIGLVEFLDLVLKESQLDNKEKEKIKNHPLIGSKILKNFEKEFDPIVIKIVEQSFERTDKKGYPFEIEPIEEAQLVNLIQKYESLLHKRTWRKNFSPLQVMKIIIEDKGFVNSKLKKVLIEMVGFYPPNTFVRLNTKEEGIVIKTNFQNPLRPFVKLLFDSHKQKLKEPKEVNLAINTNFYIEACILNN